MSKVQMLDPLGNTSGLVKIGRVSNSPLLHNRLSFASPVSELRIVRSLQPSFFHLLPVCSALAAASVPSSAAASTPAKSPASKLALPAVASTVLLISPCCPDPVFDSNVLTRAFSAAPAVKTWSIDYFLIFFLTPTLLRGSLFIYLRRHFGFYKSTWLPSMMILKLLFKPYQQL